MTELMRRRRALMTKNVSGGGGYPADFQPVEWISGNNTVVMFDTGYIVKKTDKVEIVASRSGNKSDQPLVTSWNFSIFESDYRRGNKYGFAKWGSSYVALLNDYVPEIGEVTTFVVDVPNGTFTVGDTVTNFSPPGTSDETTLRIFHSSYTGFQQIRSVKIWDSNNEIVVCAVAGYLKSTAEIVFYDTVAKNYLHAVGAGTPIKGADV